MHKFLTCLAVIICFESSTIAQTDSLRDQLITITSDKNAVVGVHIKIIETGEELTINPENKYPMMSVFKLHLGVTVLHMVDEGTFKLDQVVNIPQDDLMKNTWSPIREKYTEQNISLTIAELLHYTIAQSDNNGCDILLKLIDGPVVVNKYIHEIGIKDVQIKVSEKDMHVTPDTLYSNWTSLNAAGILLELIHSGAVLKETTNNFLIHILYSTNTGPKRLKGNLPSGTAVGHKTGTAGADNNGITAAVNDIGIIDLPNGNHMIICVFVSNTRETFDTNEKIIADISQHAWNFFSVQKK